MKLKFLFCIFLISCMSMCVHAQTRSTETVKINGQIYYMHTIKENETLENIAKAYNVAAVDIEENNPAVLVKGQLKAGMRLRIPDLNEITKKYPISQWDFVYYQVKTKKKLKEIAKEYDIDVDDIKENNPDAPNKPTILSKIRIPLKKGSKEALAAANKQTGDKYYAPKDESTSTNPALSFNWGNSNNEPVEEKPTKKRDKQSCEQQEYDPREKSFIITLLLPLNLDNPSKDISCMSFLEGALLAVDKMKSEGFSAKVIIKDVSSKALLAKALDDKEVAKSDLLIGPFAAGALKTISEFSKDNDIPFVSPYEVKSEVLAKDNSYFFQIYPSQESINSKLFKRNTANKLTNVIIAHSSAADSATLQSYKTELEKEYGKVTDYTHTMGMNAIKSKTSIMNVLKKDVPNLLFVASNDEAFVSDLLDRLIMVDNKQYPISLYGSSQWRKNFKMLNITNYYTFNLHLVEPFYVDYTDSDVKNFIQNYRESYNNEPSQYAFQGFDVSYYFMAALKAYGKNFANCLHEFNPKLLQSNYKFEQLYGEKGGWVNIGSFLLEYTSNMDIVKQ